MQRKRLTATTLLTAKDPKQRCSGNLQPGSLYSGVLLQTGVLQSGCLQFKGLQDSGLWVYTGLGLPILALEGHLLT